MEKAGIHIVSFDVPFPTDYGGIIDVYYRCKALKDIGVKVYLHCFEYGRGLPKELEEVTEKVFYYKREKSFFDLFSPLPFIVKTRNNTLLLERLNQDHLPILFEGIHTCYFLNGNHFLNRWKGVRTHNIEHDYYKGLAKSEKNIFKKLFFQLEARKLKRFEKRLHFADEIFTVTPKDTVYFRKKYQKGKYLPVFNPLNWLNSERKVENYALFHGNLSVAENENAVRFLVDKIWEKDFPALIVAGKDPTPSFLQYLKKQTFPIQCIANPSNEELNTSIQNAKINLLPTFQDTGIKHKLLNCLANGGFCLANTLMVQGTGLEDLCVIANSPEEWKERIKELSIKEEDIQLLKNRKEKLNQLFDPKKNAKTLISIIQSHPNYSFL